MYLLPQFKPEQMLFLVEFMESVPSTVDKLLRFKL